MAQSGFRHHRAAHADRAPLCRAGTTCGSAVHRAEHLLRDPSGGPAVLDESAPLWLDGPAAIAGPVDAVRILEEATLRVGGLALRYGFFYGPGTWYARDGAMAALVRKRMLPITGKGGGLASFVHVDDAVDATVAAIERGESGIYNVCDDEPVAQNVWLPELARLLGAKPPRTLPAWLVRRVAGESAAFCRTSLRAASNAKAKAAWPWAPRSWRAGFETGFSAPAALASTRMAPVTRTLAIDGADLHVEERGHGDPLLLLHGMTGTGQDWKHLFDLDSLASSGRRARRAPPPGLRRARGRPRTAMTFLRRDGH